MYLSCLPVASRYSLVLQRLADEDCQAHQLSLLLTGINFYIPVSNGKFKVERQDLPQLLFDHGEDMWLVVSLYVKSSSLPGDGDL